MTVHSLARMLLAIGFAVAIGACSGGNLQVAQSGSSALPAAKLISPNLNSGVSITIYDAAISSAQWWVVDNCGASPFSPPGGGLQPGGSQLVTQTGNDCFLAPSFTNITMGYIKVEYQCSLSIAANAAGIFHFTIINPGRYTSCTASPAYGKSTTFTWNLSITANPRRRITKG